MVLVARPLTLRSGMTLENRVVKAAMEEQLAGTGQQPDERIERLCRRWGAGGAGLLISGHVMVDRRALAQPGDIVLDHASDLAAFRRWVSAAAPTPLWMQINHPGRVVLRDTGALALAPSATRVDIGTLSSFYPTPKPMSAGAGDDGYLAREIRQDWFPFSLFPASRSFRAGPEPIPSAPPVIEMLSPFLYRVVKSGPEPGPLLFRRRRRRRPGRSRRSRTRPGR